MRQWAVDVHARETSDQDSFATGVHIAMSSENALSFKVSAR